MRERRLRGTRKNDPLTPLLASPSKGQTHSDDRPDLSHLGLDKLYPYFYLRVNGDLSELYGPDGFWEAYHHFYDSGRSEGRSATPFFQPAFYRSKYSDLADMDNTQLTQHWVDHGIGEGRQGSPVFDIGYYMNSNPDVAAAYGATNYEGGFVHWKTHGFKEPRRTTANGPQLVILDNDWSFGDVDQQLYLMGGSTQSTCGLGELLLILGTASTNNVPENIQHVIEACRTEPAEHVPTFQEIDQNQYETDQMERNASTG